jgi:MFS transporter, DHA1 family, tetracycline resistance protein
MARKPATDAQPREPIPKGYWPIWTTVLIDLIGFGMALPILGIYAKDKFAATAWQVALIGSAYSAGQFVFAPILGKLSDRIGRKPVLLLSLIGTAIGALFTAWAGSIWLLVMWRFLDGSSGASYGVANAAIGDLAPPHRRSALMGMLGAAFGIGFTVGPAMGALISAQFGQRAPFYALAGLSFLNAIAVLFRVAETKGLAVAQAEELDATIGRETLAKTWRDGALPVFLTVVLLTTFAFSAFEVLFSAFGKDNLGLTQRNAGYALAVVGIVSIIVQGGLIGPVTKKVGAMNLIRFGGIGTAIGLVMFGLASGWATLIPALIVTAAAQGFMGPSLSAEITNRVDPLKRGEVTGFVQRMSSLATIGAPLILSVAYDRISHGSPFIIGGALFAAAVALIVARVHGATNPIPA